MRRDRNGRALIEISDIDLAHGFRSMRWFWVFFAVLVVVWALS